MISGLLGLIILVLDIYAILQVLGSSAEPMKKGIWVLLIFFLPVLGLILWYLMGPKKGATPAL
ncbi:MAG: PLDc_N domain-containing protein [Alphaproteobacteria bacterium]|nr:MAG: PLDc_N domain-containing protein [Alphaproteobacteria bacterium]